VCASSSGGAFERWRIRTTIAAVTITPAWHDAIPWNYGNDELVSVELCLDDPMRPRRLSR